MEAKRRFQYKPQPKRSEQRLPDPIHSPECSSVTENNKEHSNDFSWLDKMVSNFDESSKSAENKALQLQQQQQHKPAYFAKHRVVLGEKSLNRSSVTNKPAKRSTEKSENRSKGKLHKAAVTIRQQSIAVEPELEGDSTPEPQEFPQLFPSKQESPLKSSRRKDELSSIMNKLHTEPMDVEVTVLKVEEPKRHPPKESPPV